MRSRRIVLRDAAGQELATIDTTGIAHANATAVMTLTVEALCDQEQWHTGQLINLAPWGAD